VVDALGKEIDGLGEIKTNKFRQIERVAPGIMSRESIKEPLETGIITIDALIPIGKGQRELIIGDRQTGKTSIAIDTIINQKGKNVNCIYVSIGQKNSTVASIYEKLKEKGAMEYTTIVNASASESLALQYIAPFSGVTIAEEWAENNKDVLIVFDDLSKHAVTYRALSLLLKRSPGREAYPGDIFYLHSRLLERCLKLNSKYGGGSITALPIVETQAGDISAYIPTNIISITDGQIFLSQDLFNSSFRPAINIGLSVSRVGSSCQYKAIKKVSSLMKMEIANFKELESFTQFGSDIDIETKKIIHHGNVLMSILKQPQYSPLSYFEELIYLFCAKYRFLEDIEEKEMITFLKGLIERLNNFHKDLVNKVILDKDIKKDDRDILKNIVSEYKKELLLKENGKL